MHNPSHPTNDPQNTLRTYQKNIAAIYKERRKIMQQIINKQKEHKYLNSQTDNLPKLNSFNSQTHFHQQPRKLLKTDPLSNQSIQQNNPQKPQPSDKLQTQNNKNDKPVVVPQAIADRNRRIIGGLTSYLKKAGQHLQSRVQKEKQQNSKSILNKLISKQKQERQEQQLKKKELIETQLSRLQEQKRENEEKINKAENQMLCYIVKCHLNAVGNFNLTRTEPKLFWRPRKPLDDTDKTDKLKMYAQKQLKKQQEELVERIMGYSEVFDHGKYMTQNQRQFYQSSIKNMFINHRNFILTKTEPNFFWKPAKTCKVIETLIADTNMRLDEKSAHLKTANSDYYKSREGNLNDQHNKQFSDDDYDEERN